MMVDVVLLGLAIVGTVVGVAAFAVVAVAVAPAEEQGDDCGSLLLLFS
jgi:hypothetical protein